MRKRHFQEKIPFYSKFATFRDFEKNQDFFRKILFLLQNPNVEHFEKYYYFSRILRQSCYNLMEKNLYSGT